MVKENIEQPTLTSTPSNSNLKEKKVNNTKKLNKRRSKMKLNKKKSLVELTKQELDLQKEILEKWESTNKSIKGALEKGREADIYTSSLKAIITYVVMKKMFLEVREILKESPVESLSTSFVIRFIQKAKEFGNPFETDDEHTALILVSLRYHLEPYTIAGAAWKLAEGDINRALALICPKHYAMKNRDFEFVGQEAAYLRAYWKGGIKLNDPDDEKMEKLAAIADTFDDSLITVWKRLYSCVNKSNNPMGVNQFVNILGGLSLNGYWSSETLIELIHRVLTLDWLDNRFGDSGRVVSRIWKRLYSTSNNVINREEQKQREIADDELLKSGFKELKLSRTGLTLDDTVIGANNKKISTLNELERKREFVERLSIACELTPYKKNEIAMYFDLPELYGAAAHYVMVDEDPLINQFLRYCGPCKKYPIHYAREALGMTDYHLTKTLDMLAWWKEYRNPFIISADKFWELALQTCDLDEEIIYENYGNIDDFRGLMKELIKNESFRCKEELESEEKKFRKVFTLLANGGVEDSSKTYSTKSTNSSTTSQEETDDNKPSSGVYRPPSKRGLYGLTHASIIHKRHSMNFNRKDSFSEDTTELPKTSSELLASSESLGISESEGAAADQLFGNDEADNSAASLLN
ncbi:hypothetical protein LY90DRAFT_665657 [Neocallimastix californiae]|jgi:hypothetical protein|uniref:Uncharacterized protein n=1 Tax=Neocallimastix californiae TaxID=1754190 RepID=A0A1Y2EX13_9FUNG|nr:hypothetical protein LY90DRAFT_665657 [Neocallimastix californiae]|eukprot:ORY76152.1 hypothetical protein LY90DRAFT_665657 [Neocallimastix californiae]